MIKNYDELNKKEDKRIGNNKNIKEIMKMHKIKKKIFFSNMYRINEISPEK